MNLTGIKRPHWFFYPAWVGANLLSATVSWFAYFLIIDVAARWLGHTMQVNGQTRTIEDYLFLYIFFPMLCLLSGLLQYILLRPYVPRMGGWVPATMAGCVLAFVTVALMQRAFMSTFLTLWYGVVAFATIGGAIGLCQWVFLRRRIPKAGWWILASILGWGLAVLGRLIAELSGSALVQLSTAIVSPAIIAGFAWWYLLKPNDQQKNLLRG